MDQSKEKRELLLGDCFFNPNVRSPRIAPGRRGCSVIRIAFFTGARLRDVTNLRWKSIDLEKMLISFQPMKTARSGKRMQIPIHPDLEKWLLEQPSTDDGEAFLFPDLANRTTGDRKGLSYDFQKIMKEAGIDSEYEYLTAEGSGRQRSLRHAFNSMLANAGVSQEILTEAHRACQCRNERDLYASRTGHLERGNRQVALYFMKNSEYRAKRRTAAVAFFGK